MTDRFATHAPSLDSPASTGFAVVPSDAADLPETTRALYVGTAGAVAVALASGGAPVVFPGVPGGSLLPVRAVRVLATGTSAGGIVGLA